MMSGLTVRGARGARLLLFAAAGCLVMSAASAAETADAPAPPAAAAEPAPAADAAPEALPADEAFTAEELRKLLAPFALYPDALLAQLLPASAYPVDIVLADRWLQKNKAAVEKDDFSGADAQGWDPTVKALVRFPEIIAKLNTDLDATSDLGDAFVNQPDDVAAMIQTLRREAQKAGSLKSTPQQTVTVEKQTSSSNVTTDYVVIQPADPEVIYVPTYDPATVYYDDNSDFVAGAIGFGAGVLVGAAVDNVWDWGRGWVYPPRWPGYPGYRPGYRPGGINNGNINIGNDVTIGSGNIGVASTRPWRPDAGKYHPGQGTKPGLAAREAAGNRGVGNRPGGAGQAARAGAAGRPDLGDRPNAGNRPGGNLAERPGGRPEAGARPNAGGGDRGQNARNAIADGKGGNAKDLGNRGGAKQAANKAAGAKPAAKKAAAKKPAANRQPSKGPSLSSQLARPANSAFSGASRGGGYSGAMSNRGAASRQSIARPSGGGRSFTGGGGRGGAPMMRGGGGGGRGGRR